MNNLNGFVAYPASPRQLAQSIRGALEVVNGWGGNRFSPWEENDVAGRPLTTPIFKNIEEADLLIADVTKLNFNVTYEIGYAFGRRRMVFLIRNDEYISDYELAKRVGIFDTLGYESYENVTSLANILASIGDESPLEVSSNQNRHAPVYILETPLRSNTLSRIVSRVKKARLQYRSFAPAEESRLSAIDAVNHVSSSYGVLVPLLDQQKNDADVHNIRGAFIAGISHGMSIPTLILQDQSGPVPLDVRDFVKTFSQQKDIDGHIHDFSLDVYEKIQEGDDFLLPPGKFLARLVIGDPMAENEFQTLGNYYLQTDEFNRALRGEVNLIVGRKGTGKTALFSQVRNKKRQNKKNIVVDLKPEGYQLIKLKEEVLDYLSAGAKAHLITAFWEYLLYLEVCYKVLEKDRKTYIRDPDLYGPYEELKELYLASPNVAEGDFSERLLFLSENLAQVYAEKFGTNTETRLTAENVTELLHTKDIKTLQTKLSTYLDKKGEIWILFDNLDKGWSSQGLAKGDIVILRCLIDATRKIQKKMRKDGHEFFAIVFIRNDVFQLLMDESPDFGKETRASLDWSDHDLLRELLRRRLVQKELPETATFEQI